MDNLENGALMRCGIIGLLIDDITELITATIEITMATHYEPRCVVASVFQSVLAHSLAHNRCMSFLDHIHGVLSICRKYMETTTTWLEGIVSPIIDGSFNPHSMDFNNLSSMEFAPVYVGRLLI